MKISLMFRSFIRSKIWILFFLAACGRGCSCTRVVDTAKETRKIDGIKVKVTAQKLETTTSYVFRNKPKDYSYAFEFKIKLPNRDELEHTCHIRANEDSDVDDILPTFNMTFSPDKKHFALGYGEEVYNTYHLLDKGMPFTSHHYLEYDQDHIKFSELNWGNYPNPKEIAHQLIEGEYDKLHLHERKMIQEALQEQPIPCEFDFYLMDKFPSDLAKTVFEEARVKSLTKKSDDWRQKARARAVTLLANQVHNRDATIRFVMHMNDPETFAVTDAPILDQWIIENGFNDQANRYLHLRLDKQNPKINPTLLQQLTTRANEVITLSVYKNDPSIRNRHTGEQVQFGFEFLIKTNQKEHFAEAFAAIFEGEYYEWNAANIDKIAIEKHEHLPADVQQFVIKSYQKVLPSMGTIQKRGILKFLKKKLPKEQYETLYEQHKPEKPFQ